MQLTNTTSIPNEKLRLIIRTVRPSGISNFDLMIKNSEGNNCCGRCYTRGSSYHYSTKPFIVIRIPKKQGNYPYTTYGGEGYIPFIILNKIEDVLYVIAHELRHIWQSKIKKGYRVWGARGQFSERDADAYAIRKVREYRRNTNNSFIINPDILLKVSQ